MQTAETTPKYGPVTFSIYVIKPECAALGHSGDVGVFDQIAQIITGGVLGDDRATVERTAYDMAVNELNRRYPNQWVYAYGDLDARDYSGQFHWTDDIGWRQYVPAYVQVYDPEAEARWEAERIEAEAKARVKEAEIAALPPLAIIDGKEAAWQSWLDANQDDYGGAVMIYARQWAQLAQAEIERMKTADTQDIQGVFERTSHEADTSGVTGFMYGVAVSMLSQVWVYGGALKRWHNAQYGKPDAEGVVNPALLTIGVAEPDAD